MAEITGFEELFKNLAKVQDNIKGAVALKAMDAAARRVKASAKQLCPVAKIGGGRLRNSIQHKTSNEGGETIGIVFTNVNYSQYVEFGTGQKGASSGGDKPDGIAYRADWVGQVAQPYLYPALSQNKDNIAKIVANEIKKFVGE